MKRLITASELEVMSDTELCAVFNRTSLELSKPREGFERDVLLASLENINRALLKRNKVR